MSEFNKYSTDGGATFIDVEDTNGRIMSEQLIRDTVGWTGKNLFKYPWAMSTTTWGNLTYTDNGDGTLTVNGSHTSNTQFEFFNQTKQFEGIKEGVEYILSGAPTTSESTDNMRLQLTFRDANNANQIAVICPQGGEIKFTMPVGYHPWYFVYSVAANKTVNNLTVKPMIRLATIPDDTYEPYHDNVAEEIQATYKVMGEMGAKNLAKASYNSLSSVTATVNNDGSVTLKGTNNNDSLIWVKICEFNLNSGTYTAVLSGADSNIYGYIRNVDNTAPTPRSGLTETPFTFTLNENEPYMIDVRVPANYSFPNDGTTVYPLVTLSDFYEQDSSFKPYSMTNKELMDGLKDNYKIMGEIGSKNLIPYPGDVTSYTENGTTFTRMADGAVSINGTPTSMAQIRLTGRLTTDPVIMPLKAGDYILSNDTDLTGTGIVFTTAGTKNGSVVPIGNSLTTGKSVKFTLTDDDVDQIVDGKYLVAIYVKATTGNTYNNKIVRPMLRFAEDMDDTYQPFAMTNKQLTDFIKYKKGDVIKVRNMNGYLTAGGAEIQVELHGKFDIYNINISSITMTGSDIRIRGTSGYYKNASNMEYNGKNFADYLYLKYCKVYPDGLLLAISQIGDAAFGNATNNSPVAFWGEPITITLA